MPRGARIPIRGLEHRSPVQRVIHDRESGASKIKPLVEYQTRPLDFLVDVLGFPRLTLAWSDAPQYVGHPWDGTPDPLARACRVLAGDIVGKRHVAIEAATGTQKTYTAAGLVYWFLGSFEDALVLTTGPKEKQIKEGLWKEMGTMLPAFKRRFPKCQAIDLKLRMRPFMPDPFGEDSAIRQEKWSAVGWCAGVDAGAESAVRSQGFHAEHMLVVCEEMPGMDPSIITALRNTLTAPHNLMLGLGNPDNQLDPLHIFSTLPGVEAIRISAFDHPNVVCKDPSIVPGATSEQFIAEKLVEYGPDGPLYLSRVRGQSPKEAHNALIKHAWLELAAKKWENPETHALMSQGPAALGVDPAQTENGDRCALSRWYGAVLETVETIRSRNALVFGKDVWQIMQDEGIAPEYVGVDSVGVGSNVVNYLADVLPPGKYIKKIEGGAEDALQGVMKTAGELKRGGREYQTDANKFLNMRAQVYWQLAQDLAHERIAIPRHEGLWRELLAPTYKTEGGEVVLQKKKEIVKKLGRSPDYADAVAYGNWVRPRALPKAPREAKYDKTPHVARPWHVDEEGHVAARAKTPKSLEELVARIGGERHEGRSQVPFRRLVPPRR